MRGRHAGLLICRWTRCVCNCCTWQLDWRTSSFSIRSWPWRPVPHNCSTPTWASNASTCELGTCKSFGLLHVHSAHPLKWRPRFTSWVTRVVSIPTPPFALTVIWKWLSCVPIASTVCWDAFCTTLSNHVYILLQYGVCIVALWRTAATWRFW